MDPLQTGLIRLIGRYWTPDSTYLITLKAKEKMVILGKFK